MPNSGSMMGMKKVEGAEAVPFGRFMRAEGEHHEF
jgi:hypothetical protein